MTNNGITVLPYIDENKYKTGTKEKKSVTDSTKIEKDLSFNQQFITAQRAAAALAVDQLVEASNSKAVNSTDIQKFLDKNKINITIANTTAAPSAITNSKDNGDKTISDTNNKSLSNDVKSNMTNTQTSINKASYSNPLQCSEELEGYFKEASEKYGVDIKFLKSIAKQESNFDPNSTSHSGAMGIMQLMPFTAEELGVSVPYDPRSSIMGGAELIAKLLDKYKGDKTLALAAYNAGSGSVAKYGGVPPYEETQNYVRKVLAYYNS